MVRCAAVLFTVLTIPAAAADAVFKAPDYQECIAKIAKAPADAFEEALTWHDRGGGAAAQHCAAMALLALDRPGDAARRLDAVAQDPEAGSAQNRAALLDQAGNAWLLADRGEDAEASFAAGLKVTPRDAGLLVDRARARAMQRNWSGAETDLSAALGIAKRPETYVLRASARKALGHLKEARADIEAALALDPRFADALVERGSFRLMAGDKAGARADWLKVLLIDAKSPAADEARRRIADMEVHTDR